MAKSAKIKAEPKVNAKAANTKPKAGAKIDAMPAKSSASAKAVKPAKPASARTKVAAKSEGAKPASARIKVAAKSEGAKPANAKSSAKPSARTTVKSAKPANAKPAKETQKVELKLDAPDELAFDVNALPGGVKSAVEAILITCSEPQSVDNLAITLAVSKEIIESTLLELKNEYNLDQRGFEIKEYDGLWRFYSAAAFSDVVSKHIIGRSESKLSIAALETLAIIAYRQPISRFAIQQIRGVSVDGVVRTLLQRGLISEESDKNGAFKYRTTELFLEKVGLNSIKDLEPLAPFLPAEFEDIPEFEDIRKTNRSKQGDANDGELGGSLDN